MAVKAGCDLNCGCTYEHLPSAVEQGLLEESDLDRCLVRVFRARFLLGMFDPPERVRWSSIPYEVNDSPEHRQLSLVAARESIVLLKNRNALLPLSKTIGSIAVIGPNAYDPHVLVANYFGMPSYAVTPLEGIRQKVSPKTKIWHTDGCKLLGTRTDGLQRAGNLSEAVSMASRADVTVLCLGLSAEIEGEQGDASNSEAAGDKLNLSLTGLQDELLRQIVALGKPTVLVLIAGSPVELGWAQDHVDAIVDLWYPGQEGGTALADVLFGDHAPGGRLPITFPRSIDHVPPFADYAMKGRTYRYLEHAPLYPFGFGLSYTSFEYSKLVLSTPRLESGQTLELSVEVRNTGARRGDEVVQLYLKDLEATTTTAHHSLRGFERITLDPGEKRAVVFRLSPRDLTLIDDRGRRVLEPGRFRVFVGGSQPDPRSVELLGRAPLAAEFDLVGERVELPY
jgi:beta-glucosidase